jgi:uncharacterized protein (DUF362 family)
MSKVVVVRGRDASVMVKKGLDELNIEPHEEKIVIKPNLILARPFPITTPAETVDAIVEYFKRYGREIVIAEGSGWCRTSDAFKDLGYFKIAERYNIGLIDLNENEYEVMFDPDVYALKRFEFPLTLKGSYVISTAVLKRHSITAVTLSLKNMLGAALGEGEKVVAKKGCSIGIWMRA